MKSALFVLAILIVAVRLPAQTNAPVRLALVSDTDETSTAADVLTAELSGHKNVQLLERDEIEKVYREQGLSAGNKDYLKLGQILGADGLLLLDVVRTPQATNLMARLIAVKPGVILTDGSFAWPLKDTTQWADSVSSYLDLLLPKLSVQAKDAVPISVVNLRSAVASAEGAETERQLKLLTIQRLSQEKELFVLERQKMQLLSEEKELKADDSAFWNGSYLLEGVVDQNGYSQETITINARLTPSKGGVPLSIAVSGSRTNLAEVINQLADNVNKALKVNSSVPEWNAADEAAQFFAEAQWALRWGAYSEAQAAADSAWALGKKDLACALVRVKAYLAEVSAEAGEFQSGEATISSGYDANNRPLGPAPTETVVQEDINRVLSKYHFGVVYRTHEVDGAKIVEIRFATQAPDPVNISRAMHVLELYYEFSRSSINGQPQVLSSGPGWNDWHNSDWYNLGVESLIAASKVLQGFNLIPASQVPVADKLRGLRALARSVAGMIFQSPSIYDSYFVGDRIATHDELAYTIGGERQNDSNIFNCEVAWGCLWQETPEDCIALYRELMSSPVFCYIHSQFWQRQAAFNHVIGWTEEDNKRAFQVWNGFVQELNNSTNVLLRMEAKALAMTDAQSEKQSQSARNDLFELIRSNRTELVANNVELFYMGWGLDYANAELAAMDQEYWNKTIPARLTALAFEKQKQYLASFTPYDFQTFQQTFTSRSFTKAQAAQLLPLLAAFKSNLLAQASSGPEKFKAQSDVQWIAFSFEKGVNEILNPPTPLPAPAKSQTPKPIAIAKTAAPIPPLTNAPEVVNNILTVSKFLPIPLDGLTNDQISGVTITAHHWLEGKLLLDFQYGTFLYSFDAKGNWQQTRSVAFPAIAILDPLTEHWEVISCPEMDIPAQIYSYHSSMLWHGQLFNSGGGQIKKYDFADRQWQELPVSDGSDYELFNVNDHLYAANRNMIFEIIDNGKSTRILASNRRNPPVSKLDTEDLGTPTLFEGPDHSFRVCTKNKIFTWVGNDWREDGAAPPFTFQPDVFADGALFRQSEGGYSKPDSLNFLAAETNAAELWLLQKVRPPNPVNFNTVSRTSEHKVQDPEPLWNLPANLALASLPAAAYESGLFLLMDHSEVQDIINEQRHVITGKKLLPKDGYNSALLCFSRGLPSPQELFLKFEDPHGCPPVTGINPDSRPAFPGAPPVWLLFTTNLVFFGGGNLGDGYQTGVWLLPVSKIEPVIAEQKKIQFVQNAQAAAQAIAVLEQTKKEKAQVQQDFLAKYDQNHNGIIDPVEVEAALDDPTFIESKLDVIDANHNGWLDVNELVYFDANNNKILEPKEQAGIEIAQHLLAERLLKKFDANDDGALDRSEFGDLVQSIPEAIVRPTPNFPVQFPDESHDGKIDLAELESFLRQQLRQKLRPQGAMGAAYFSQMIAEPGKRADASQSFKAYVELYWQNSGAITNKLPSTN